MAGRWQSVTIALVLGVAALITGCSDAGEERLKELKKAQKAAEDRGTAARFAVGRLDGKVSELRRVVETARAARSEAQAALSAQGAQQKVYQRMVERDLGLASGKGRGWRDVFQGRLGIAERELAENQPKLDQAEAESAAMYERYKAAMNEASAYGEQYRALKAQLERR